MSHELIQAWIAEKNSREPWQKWFAWYPVWTIRNERVWFQTVYRRKHHRNWLPLNASNTNWEYATVFDILSKT